ncbi:hypothetical protein [Rhodococcus sp. NPDC076796]|uniref:hypothetical protein n=1 Tax=Rhodococcus sp. NPDC076796 TaxID=3154859 RepID=UPI002AD8386C|nr:hypothetical protein [Rhodococcus sp. (in: high G+C Gram-positive bacteria)]
MNEAYIVWVSVAFQVVILILSTAPQNIYPKAQPIWINFLIATVLIQVPVLILTGAASSLVTGEASFALYPASTPAWVVGLTLLTLGISSPLAGLLEWRFRRHGNEVFDAKKRFRGHFLGNLTGALAAAGFFWAVERTPGFTAWLESYQYESAFNIVLPLVTLVIFAFVRYQQLADCPNLDDKIKADHQDWKSCIRGSSLSNAHQVLNTIFLIAVTFIGASAVLYLFSYAIVESRHNTPIDFSAQLGLAISALLVFLIVCGLPQGKLWDSKTWSWNRAVYLTFLTGTPATLVATMVWLALVKDSPTRNIFAITIVGAGYLLYSSIAILGVVYSKRPSSLSSIENDRQPERLQLHYFAGAILAVALTIFLGVLYFTSTP